MKTRFQRSRALVLGFALAATLHLGVTPAAAAIVALLESPTSSELSSGIANVQGWAFATLPGDEIEPLIDIYIDGQFVMEVPCCSDRGDVKVLHPSAPMQTGFSGAFNFSSLNPGAHTLKAHVYSKLGDHIVLTENFQTAALGSFPYNKEFDWDDAQADHCEPVNIVVNGAKTARLVCHGMTFSNGVQTEQCVGEVELTWMSSSQGFRVTKGCDQLN